MRLENPVEFASLIGVVNHLKHLQGALPQLHQISLGNIRFEFRFSGSLEYFCRRLFSPTLR